jgi:predicted SnoaL-like aldol condensation-catalyzing enzyme
MQRAADPKPRRNDALIRRIYSGGFARDAYAPDVVWHVEGNHPLAGEHRGRDAVFEAFRGFEERSHGTIRTIVVSVLAEDGYALAVIHATGVRETRNYDCCEFDVFRISDGVVVETWSFSADQSATDAFWS